MQLNRIEIGVEVGEGGLKLWGQGSDGGDGEGKGLMEVMVIACDGVTV